MAHRIEHRSRPFFLAVALSGSVLSFASAAVAGIHTWDVKEVFSNASGTIQYIELIDNGVTGGEVGVGNGSLTELSFARTHSWANGAVATPTNGRSYLIASQTFANLPGAPTPDVIIPVAKMPFFNPAGDTIGFAGVDSWTFGAVPTNGTQSLDRLAGVAANSPKNYAGSQGSVNAAPAPVPSVSPWMVTGLVAAMGALGVVVLRRRAQAIG